MEHVANGLNGMEELFLFKTISLYEFLENFH